MTNKWVMAILYPKVPYKKIVKIGLTNVASCGSIWKFFFITKEEIIVDLRVEVTIFKDKSFIVEGSILLVNFFKLILLKELKKWPKAISLLRFEFIIILH